jgi:hypothetical protein
MVLFGSRAFAQRIPLCLRGGYFTTVVSAVKGFRKTRFSLSFLRSRLFVRQRGEILQDAPDPVKGKSKIHQGNSKHRCTPFLSFHGVSGRGGILTRVHVTHNEPYLPKKGQALCEERQFILSGETAVRLPAASPTPPR